MPQPLNGPGVGLPIPQYLYPSELSNAPYDLSTNQISLSPGDELPIPAGTWFVTLGDYSVLQFLDPVMNVWRPVPSARGQLNYVKSDGFNLRVANLLGCPVGAVVSGGGSAYAQASTTIAANTGGSLWQPIVGGAISYTSMSNAGAGYTVPPLVFIPAPPSYSANGVGGIQATAVASIANNTVSGITMTNVGAGYTSLPTIQILPNPTDPNIGNVTQATAVFALANSGSITGALCTNPGAPLATLSALTLTASGVGSGATITPVILQTVTLASIVAAGAGLGLAAVPCGVGSVDGVPASVSALTNPQTAFGAYRMRPFLGTAPTTTGGALSGSVVTIRDGGLFVGTPTPVLFPGAAGAGTPTLASIAFTMGATVDTITLQPAP